MQRTPSSSSWVFTEGVDDAPSECALDGREWDLTLSNDDNNGPSDAYTQSFDSLVARIKESLASS
eukprot:m.110784 g.110784  ORF g.110784 m.110784 type:complete len:65 (+) comp9350_c0_seq3:498-692(+)